MSAYSFGKAWGMLDEPDFQSDWVDSVLSITKGINLNLAFPLIRPIALFLDKYIPGVMPIGYKRLVNASPPFPCILRI